MAHLSKDTEKGTVTVHFNDGTKAVFKQPQEKVLAVALARRARDPYGMVDVLVANCLVEGDKDMGQKTPYLTQMNGLADQIFGEVECEIEWDGDDARVEYLDGKAMLLRVPSRQTLTAANMKARTNPLGFFKTIINGCWVSGDEEVKSSPGHLLGFAAVVDELCTRGSIGVKNS